MKSGQSPSLKRMRLSLIFSALSDPVRLEIVQTLLKETELPCGHCRTELSKSTMSHHFKVLREAGIIRKREEGKVHHISVRKEELEARLPGIIEALKKAGGPL
jgi:DNA-binding transcriptional ArsR family regulator